MEEEMGVGHIVAISFSRLSYDKVSNLKFYPAMKYTTGRELCVILHVVSTPIFF